MCDVAYTRDKSDTADRKLVAQAWREWRRSDPLAARIYYRAARATANAVINSVMYADTYYDPGLASILRNSDAPQT